MILVWGGREGRWVDWDLWNPYSIGSNHQNGPNLIYEPLAYYSAFADKTQMWLAESYVFAPDFRQLTIKTRPGIAWSDGEPFGASVATKALDAMFLVSRYVVGNGKPAIENEVGDRYEKHLLLLFFFVEPDVAQDAALVS